VPDYIDRIVGGRGLRERVNASILRYEIARIRKSNRPRSR
jgi:hypothetical protein